MMVSTHISPKWAQIATIAYVPNYRNGWLGVIDALKSAVTGRPRFSVAIPVTIGFWHKGAPIRHDQLYVDAAGIPKPRISFVDGVEALQ